MDDEAARVTIPPSCEGADEDPRIIDRDRSIHLKMSRDEDDEFYKGLYGVVEKILVPSPVQVSVEEILKLKNEYVLKMDDFIDFQKRYLISEHATPVLPHFKKLHENYLSTPGVKTHETWVNFIKDAVFQVAGDVVKGWQYLDDNGFSCGSCMEGLIFVRKDGRGLLMPRVHKTSNEGDFGSFVGILEQVLQLQPGSGPSTEPTDKEIYAIEHLIWSASIKGVSDSWLFNAPAFWDVQKAIFFIISVDHLLKRDDDFYQKMKMIMDGLRSTKSGEPNWAGVLNNYPMLLAIYTSGAGVGYYSPASYHLNMHRIRFARNVLMHYLRQGVSMSQIMQELESAFPDVLYDIFYSICLMIEDRYRLRRQSSYETQADAEMAFLRWTSKGGIFC